MQQMYPDCPSQKISDREKALIRKLVEAYLPYRRKRKQLLTYRRSTHSVKGLSEKISLSRAVPAVLLRRRRCGLLEILPQCIPEAIGRGACYTETDTIEVLPS